jgi:hypothetical protein
MPDRDVREQTSKKRWLEDPSVYILIVTALTILATIIMAEIQPAVGWKRLLVGLAVVVSIYATLVFTLQKPFQAQLREGLKQIESLLAPHSISWLLDTEGLKRFEEDGDAKEIWLLTSDLLDDLEGGPFREVVKAKMKTGTRYVYFVPDTAEIAARVRMMMKSYKDGKGPHVVYLPDSFFFLVPKLDIVIYDPLSESSVVRCAFMGIPVPGESRHYHAAVNNEFIDKLVGTLVKQYPQRIGTILK